MTNHSKAAWREYPFQTIEFPSTDNDLRSAFDAGREVTILEIQHPGSCQDCGHRSDCALHNRPAMPVEPCDCGDRA